MQSGFWRCLAVIIRMERREGAVCVGGVGEGGGWGRDKSVCAAASVVGCTESALQHKHFPLMNNPLPNNKGVASLKRRPWKFASHTFPAESCAHDGSVALLRWRQATPPCDSTKEALRWEVGHQQAVSRPLLFSSSLLSSAFCTQCSATSGCAECARWRKKLHHLFTPAALQSVSAAVQGSMEPPSLRRVLFLTFQTPATTWPALQTPISTANIHVIFSFENKRWLTTAGLRYDFEQSCLFTCSLAWNTP